MERFFTGVLNLFNMLLAWLVSSDILLYFLGILVVYSLLGVVVNRVIR